MVYATKGKGNPISGSILEENAAAFTMNIREQVKDFAASEMGKLLWDKNTEKYYG